VSERVSDFIVQRLKAWGVQRVFGYPGDGINGVMGAINRAGDEPRFVQVRHEEMAALMACAHAKYTGEVGVCMATGGPGAIHLLNGLYDAAGDHMPVVAIIGQAARFSMGSDFQQETDLASLFKDVAHHYCQTVTDAPSARHIIDRAFRIAIAERAVTAVILPKDVQDLEAEAPPRVLGATFSGVGYSAPRVLPTDADLRRAADVLNAGQKVAMLIGAGAMGATDEVIATAELLGAGVAYALLGKSAIPNDLPFVTGAIGLLGTRPSYDLMAGCDTLLMVGTNFPYADHLPKEGQARGVQIDLAARNLGLRYPMEVNLHGDSAETLRALMPLLTRKTDRTWRDEIERGVRDWHETAAESASRPANPLNPQWVFAALSERLPDDALLSVDSGTSTAWYARDIVLRRGMMGTLSGSLATMGCALPYALAAKFAYPHRLAVALVGDGAMQMNGSLELISAAKYYREWADPRLIVLVLNNHDLSYVTWEMRASEGDPKFDASQELPDFPYARYAESLGLRGIRVDTPEAVPAALDAAFAADRPIVIEAVTDPNVPILPPHITTEQMKGYLSAVLKGDPDALDIIRQSVRDAPAVLKGLAPHRD